MNIRTRTCLVMCALWLALPAAAQSSQASDPVDRGRYLAQISGCNYCHTPG